MQDKIEVIWVRPECVPEVIEIDNNLKSMQRLVGGNIEECVIYADGVALIANEESILRELPFNRAVYDSDDYIYKIMHGNFFLCYVPEGSEEYSSIPENLKEEHLEEFKDVETCEIDKDNGMLAVYSKIDGFRAAIFDAGNISAYSRVSKLQKGE